MDPCLLPLVSPCPSSQCFLGAAWPEHALAAGFCCWMQKGYEKGKLCVLQSVWRRSGRPWGLADVLHLEEPQAQLGTKICL